jgi:hypothetical protein
MQQKINQDITEQGRNCPLNVMQAQKQRDKQLGSITAKGLAFKINCCEVVISSSQPLRPLLFKEIPKTLQELHFLQDIGREKRKVIASETLETFVTELVWEQVHYLVVNEDLRKTSILRLG